MTRPKGSKNKARYHKLCEYCGIKFVAMRSDARFCNASHKSMYYEGIRRDIEAAKIAETQNKIETLIRELEKSDQVEINAFADQLRDWLNKFTDKLRGAIKNKDLRALEEIHTKLVKAVDELTLIENE